MAIKLHFPGINLDDTFDCGQCFRWEKVENSWQAWVEGELVEIASEGDFLSIKSQRSQAFWKEYLHFEHNPSNILKNIPQNYRTQNLIKAHKAAAGVRILRQNKWETLISFIISQNNNIPRIKGIIERLCTDENGNIAAFPSPQKILEMDLAPLRAGFRAKYILSAAEMCKDNFLENIACLPTPQLRLELMKIHGVGKKIADCTMLFAYGRYEVFPQDVWIKRIMQEEFAISPSEIENFIVVNFAQSAGYIQQYLYHYFRNLKTK